MSPAASSESYTAPVAAEGGEPLTEERVERLNQETTVVPTSVSVSMEGASHPPPPSLPAAPDQLKRKVGYKNIPSLDAITARIAKQRAMSLSVDGSANPPEPEMIEDPKTPGVSIKPPEHPLQFTWCAFPVSFFSFSLLI